MTLRLLNTRAIGRTVILACLAVPLSAQSRDVNDLPGNTSFPIQHGQEGRVTLIQKKIKGGGADCEDREFHVIFQLPPKWSIQTQGRGADAGVGEPLQRGARFTSVNLRNPEWKTPVRIYYRLNTQPTPPEEIVQSLQDMVQKKIDQRTREGFSNYHIRAENCERRQVGTRPGLSCIAEYSYARKTMAEYLTWIRSETCLAQIFILQVPPDKMGDIKSNIALERLIQSLRIP